MKASVEKYFPGKTDRESKNFELNYWISKGVHSHELHLETYRRGFPLNQIKYNKEAILDVGSGAISIFENIAPLNAGITPFDILAEEYNKIIPDKKFQIKCELPEDDTYSLITIFNMIDHVSDPEDLLCFLQRRLREGGKIWLAVHLYRPHGIKGHPQKFTCKSIVDLLGKYFSIESVTIIREGVPIPYMWCGILSHKNAELNMRWRAVLKGYVQYLWFQVPRVHAKFMKIIGLRFLLPQRWRF